MAEITAQRKGQLIRGVFKILLDNPDGLQAKYVLAKLEGEVPPSEFESTHYPNWPNVRRYEKIVRFSTIVMVKAAWLEKEKGFWSLTDAGKSAYEKYPDPEDFYREAVALYRQWKQEQPTDEELSVDKDTAETVTAVEEAEESAWMELEEHLTTMNPYDFQNLVAGLLRGMGYHISWISPPGPDKGLDILAHIDPMGIEGPRIKIQVKRQKEKVTVDGLRSFMALLGDSDVGLFVCTGGFTKDAESEARYQEKRRMTLVSLKKLFDLWVEHYDAIPEEYRRLLPLRAVYFLAPTD